MTKKSNRQPGIHLHKTSVYAGAIKTDKVNKNIYEVQWYWILIAKNGRTIAKSSETYKRKAGAIRSIEIVASHFENNMHYYDHTTGGVGVDLVVYNLTK